MKHHEHRRLRSIAVDDERRLRERSIALDALPDEVKKAAAALAVALANHHTHGDLKHVRAKAYALFAAGSLSTVGAGEWREWARLTHGWMRVAAGTKSRSLHTVVRRKRTELDTDLSKFDGSRRRTHPLVNAQRAWRSVRKSNITRFVQMVMRYARYVHTELLEHLNGDFSHGAASPIELAAVGAALVMHANTTFEAVSTRKSFQTHFGLCPCGRFFFKPDSRGAHPPRHCGEYCRAAAEQARRYRRQSK
jgi:hypothetical protein